MITRTSSSRIQDTSKTRESLESTGRVLKDVDPRLIGSEIGNTNYRILRHQSLDEKARREDYMRRPPLYMRRPLTLKYEKTTIIREDRESWWCTRGEPGKYIMTFEGDLERQAIDKLTLLITEH